MIILGIESSCDETAAAVVEDGCNLLSNVVSSQADIHKQYGGVVPEVAARSHIEVINPVINQALSDAGKTWQDIDAIGVTHGAGLGGPLLVGTLAARTYALAFNKPIYGLNHVLGHLYANFLSDQPPEFPILGLIVSGGHSQLVLIEDHFKYRLLGQTRDDAVGEAFDKVAKILGLGYPGGPNIAKAAINGDANSYKFPIAKLDNPYEFSFSGVKTAVLRQVQQICGKDYSFPSHQLKELLNEQIVSDVAASFQKTAVETLVRASKKAFDEFQPKNFIIGGGVAASTELRRQLTEALPIAINYPPIELCTDNAAMMATLCFYYAQYHQPDSPYSLSIDSNLKM